MKIKTLPFIFIGTIVHIGLGMAVISTQLDCGIQPNCIPDNTKAFANILGFPLNLVTWMWQRPDGGIPSWAFLAFFVNSVLAVTTIWLVLKTVLRFFKKGET